MSYRISTSGMDATSAMTNRSEVVWKDDDDLYPVPCASSGS